MAERTKLGENVLRVCNRETQVEAKMQTAAEAQKMPGMVVVSERAQRESRMECIDEVSESDVMVFLRCRPLSLSLKRATRCRLVAAWSQQRD